MDYFKEWSHSTKAVDISSLISWINASIIQGSGIGPSSYVVAALDLHPRHKQNAMTKFADDTCLLVGSTSIGTLVDEFDNIKKWAENNNMRIHSSKTKELIVSRARSRTTQVPSQPFIEGAERVTTLRVLGVILDSKLTMSDHVSQVLSTSWGLLILIDIRFKTPPYPRLKKDELRLVTRATTVASIL